jgi:hypothetical protein
MSYGMKGRKKSAVPEGSEVVFKGSNLRNSAYKKGSGLKIYNGKVSAPKNNGEGFPMVFVIPNLTT